MEKTVSQPHNQTNQSQEFTRSSVTFYPSPSSLIGDSEGQQKKNYKSPSQTFPTPSNSFTSPYDIEENQFNHLFNSNNDDYSKDNNLRNQTPKKKIMDGNSLIKQKYVTFILDNERKSRNSNESSNTSNFTNSESNMQRSNASKFMKRHETFEEAGGRIAQSENKNATNIQTRYLRSSNVDQRSARKCFLHPSAASTAILNRRLATAKSTQRKNENLLGNSMLLYDPNSKSRPNQNADSLSKKSSVVSIIIENNY
ncbi:hypothetical protein M9Y10_044906 [Tritrichomonas musculus]|uniref:Uncharacterized protein n=1 Tax=Tritrichomonas musculus TaxID=1915356 RepID=A0ABR2JU29_9EUKA